MTTTCPLLYRGCYLYFNESRRRRQGDVLYPRALFLGPRSLVAWLEELDRGQVLRLGRRAGPESLRHVTVGLFTNVPSFIHNIIR